MGLLTGGPRVRAGRSLGTSQCCCLHRAGPWTSALLLCGLSLQPHTCPLCSVPVPPPPQGMWLPKQSPRGPGVSSPKQLYLLEVWAPTVRVVTTKLVRGGLGWSFLSPSCPC